ncbi:MAG: class I SAM-dependent methyltransferase [Caldilineaceae bacterium]|nr:class I SAM-dependent methyltransferase [Caldilineaceae bacterium]
MESADFDAFAPFYDADYRHYDDDLQMIVDLAQMAGERALELGCGTGRALLPLAAVGHLVTGVDQSEALLAQAEEKVKQARLSSHVQLVRDDLRTFHLETGEFDFAYCVSNTLMHLTTQEAQLAALTNAARHLHKEGLLLIDLFNPDIVRLAEVAGVQELADHWIDEASGAQIFKWSVRHLDVAQQLQETLFLYEEIFPDGRMRKRAIPFTLRFLWPSEGKLLLQMAGFRIEALYGDFDGNPYDDSSERLIFLARKM